MPKKRRSRGRTGSSGGRDHRVQCAQCGQMVPRGKAKRVSRRVSLVDRQIGQELRKQETIMPYKSNLSWYCVSCAVTFKKVKIRSKDERKDQQKIY